MAKQTETEPRIPADRTLDPLENIDEPEEGGLPPFQEGPVRCKKCGFVEVPDTSYHSEGLYIDGQVPEHLERECIRCGFTWREALAV